MFEKLRRPVSGKNLFASFLFGLIIFVFVFFGLDHGNQMGINDAGGSAAVIGNRIISIAEFQNRMQNAEQQYQTQLANLPAAQRQEIQKGLRARVLEQLINQELISLLAERSGIQVADSEIREAIVTIPYLQSNGQFDRSKYTSFLQAIHMSADQYESKIRDQMASTRLTDLFRNALSVSNFEKQRDQKLQATKLNFEFVKLNSRGTVNKTDIEKYLASDEGKAATKKYYDENQVDYTDKVKGPQPYDVVAPQVAEKLLMQKKWGDTEAQVATLSKEGKDEELKSLVKSQGLKWDETGEFDLRTEALPKLGESDEVFSAFFQLPANRRSSIFYVQMNQSPYLVRLKSMRTDSAVKKDSLPAFNVLAYRQSEEAFERWAGEIKNSEKIKRNPKLIEL